VYLVPFDLCRRFFQPHLVSHGFAAAPPVRALKISDGPGSFPLVTNFGELVSDENGKKKIIISRKYFYLFCK
jgi:hypothetical protein